MNTLDERVARLEQAFADTKEVLLLLRDDIRRIDARIDGVEQRLSARMDRLEAALQRLTFWILGALASTIIMFITLLLRRP